jgi:hypothetical protein
METPVIPVNKVVEEKRIIVKRGAEEEVRHAGSLFQSIVLCKIDLILNM